MGKGKDLFNKGAIQLSRKYHIIAVPPEGKTGRDLLHAVDPEYVRRREEELEKDYMNYYLSVYHSSDERIELTEEEFDEFLQCERAKLLERVKELRK
jgi:hypothetical protein